MMLRAALVLLALGGAAAAQSFDNFGDEPIEGFDPGDIDGIIVPSLGADGTLPDSDIELQITEGQPGVAITTIPGTGTPVTSVQQPPTAQAARATLRALDKTLGRPTDVDLAVGETVVFGRIAIELVECRFPEGDPASDAFAHLRVFDLTGNALFDGWMVASSPALSALEHARYDVWVLRCDNPI